MISTAKAVKELFMVVYLYLSWCLMNNLLYNERPYWATEWNRLRALTIYTRTEVYDTQCFKQCHVPFLVSTNQWIAINIVNATRLLGFILSNVCHTLSTGIKPLRHYHRLLPSITDPPKGEDSTDNKYWFRCFTNVFKESDEQTCLFLSLFKGLDVFRSKGAHCVRLMQDY